MKSKDQSRRLSLPERIVMLLDGLTIREAKQALEDDGRVMFESQITYPPKAIVSKPERALGVSESSRE